MWTGWSDEQNEGTYIDANLGQVLPINNSSTYAPFYTGEPNGEEAENCVVSNPDGTWWDAPCNYRFIGSCLLRHMPPQFKLTGTPW